MAPLSRRAAFHSRSFARAPHKLPPRAARVRHAPHAPIAESRLTRRPRRFFKDPSGNNLEFKAMKKPENLFAKYYVAE